MAEQESSAVQDDVEREDESDEQSQPPERQSQAKGDDGADVQSWTIRGAAFGAVAGAAAGAGIGALFAARPDVLENVKSGVGGSGRQVARAAAHAASEVMTSRSVNQLVRGNGNGDRGRLMKDAAREAAAAAATAARDAIVELRGGS
jgi:hypothetical protein